MKVFDPRIDKSVNSDNPALILADIIKDMKVKVKDDFWDQVKELADYYDQGVEERNGKTT